MAKIVEVAGRVTGAAGKVAGSAGRAVVDVARPVGQSAIGFWRGITYPFRGASFVYLRNPGLVRFWIWPLLITALFLVLVGWGALGYYDSLVALVWKAPVGTGFWHGVLRVLHTIVELLVALVLLGMGLITAILLSNVFAAPFKDLLSEEVERLRIGRGGPPFSLRRLVRETARTVGIELFKLVLYLLVMVPLLLVTLVPVVGHIVYSVVGFLFTSIYFAVDYIDWPASRRSRSLGYRASMVRRHFWPMLGFGTGVWLFLFVPLVNLLFMPAAVAGGTMLFLDLETPENPPNEPPSALPVATPAPPEGASLA